MIRDAKAFYDGWRAAFGPVSQKQVDRINAILAEIEALGWTDPRWAAYTLATAYWETDRFMAMEEYGRGAGKPYTPWWGRGFVMLTWEANYRKLGSRLGFDLIANPDTAKQPEIAAAILCIGMVEGLFTGKGLPDYFDADADDPVNARRIVNGTDKAREIAAQYRKILVAVKAGSMEIAMKPPLVNQPSSLPTRKIGAVGIAGALLTYIVEHQAELALAVPALAPALPMVVSLAPFLPFVVGYFIRDRA
jgi:predicted chitinase